jgi:hypothetical protein
MIGLRDKIIAHTSSKDYITQAFGADLDANFNELSNGKLNKITGLSDADIGKVCVVGTGGTIAVGAMPPFGIEIDALAIGSPVEFDIELVNGYNLNWNAYTVSDGVGVGCRILLRETTGFTVYPDINARVEITVTPKKPL